MSSISEIGVAIRQARKHYNLTQQQLGDLVGLSDKTIRDIEKGTGSPSLASAIAAMEALGITVQVNG